MKKRHKITLPTAIEIKNPVAKYAGQFNKAQVFKDKTKYQRGAKHKGKEAFVTPLGKGMIAWSNAPLTDSRQIKNTH